MANELPPFQSLAGHLLIATQDEAGTFFYKTVILITHHTEQDGAVGYVINRDIKTVSLKDVFKHRDISSISPKLSLKNGGPVDLGHGIVLHTDDYKTIDTKQIANHLAITETQQILDDISDQICPHHFMILIGKSAWAPGQLEEEIMSNMWIVADPTIELVFQVPDNKKWQEALATLKIDSNLWTNHAGKA